MHFFFLLLLMGIAAMEVSAQQLHINEVMASNNATIADEDGDFEDWIEIYNSGNDPISLEGYGLSDDYDQPFKWEFPDTTIQPGSFMLVWASNKDRPDPGSELHTNFAISTTGEEIILTNPDGTRLDELTPTEIPTDISIGRQPDGSGDWVFFNEPTPGAANTTQSINDLLESPTLSHQPGFYSSGFNLELSHSREDVTIYYTLDGSTPSENSTVYEGPIIIQDRSNEPNKWSTIRTNHLTDRYGFNEPAGLVPKGTVLSTLAVKTGYLPTRSIHSFFVSQEGNNAHTLPVISISTDSLNFFGHDEGILVPGAHYSEQPNTGNYYQRGREWEREATFEFFNKEGDLKFAQNVGLRIHGGFTRRYNQKSFRVYARSEYGENRINYPIFPNLDDDSFKRLLLRNSGNEQGYTMFRDAAAQTVVSHFNMDTQAYQPSVVYINGEYWGILNIRERYDRHYLERVYGIDPDNIDLLTGRWDPVEGDNNQYRSVLNFIDREGLVDDNNLRHVNTLIDLDNFLDYYTAQIYFINTDWPYGNIDYWRLKVPYNENAPAGHDGRWRWLFYDIDFSFGFVRQADYDMLDYVTRQFTFEDSEWPNLILRNLLENESFTHDFINRMADHLNTTFKTDRVLGVIDSLQTMLEPEMPEFINRWSYPTHMGQWGGFVNSMRDFARDRPNLLRQNIIDHFNLESTAEFTINNVDTDRGTVYLNSLLISPKTEGISNNPFPWTGTYFTGIPVTIKPVPEKGFVLSHWEVDGEMIYDRELTILPDATESVLVAFEPVSYSNIPSHVLSGNPYLLFKWDEDEPAGTYPEAMAFVYMDEPDPGSNAGIAGLVQGEYNLNSQTRINGLGENGFAFINTSNPDGNPGYPGTRLGGAILALDTRDISGAEVGFEAGTIEPNSRIYNLRLQYRTDSDQSFRDLLDEEGNPIEYKSQADEGHSEFIGPVSLPNDAIGKSRVELLWRYYYTGEQLDAENNQSTKLNISAIHVAETTEVPKPDAYDLGQSSYQFHTWPADTIAGRFPESMAFVYMNQTDPGLDASILGHTYGTYNQESRTRINGLGDDGFAFINTSNPEGNPGYPGTRLGGALLALNTEDRGGINVMWTGGTVQPNSRIYNIRLQYRVGSEGEFTDVPDHLGNPVEYRRNDEEGHSEQIGPFVLPIDSEDQPRVELLWRYYYTGERIDEESGQRSMLNISSISVSSFSLHGGGTGTPQDFKLFQNYPNPFYPHTTIRYDLPSDQHVRIDLYTITSQHIGTLFNGEVRAGRHIVSVDASALASGIYIYRLVSKDFTGTGKMSVIK